MDPVSEEGVGEVILYAYSTEGLVPKDMIAFTAPANLEYVRERFKDTGIEVIPSAYCPCLTKPSRWRRWVRREKPEPIVHVAPRKWYGTT